MRLIFIIVIIYLPDAVQANRATRAPSESKSFPACGFMVQDPVKKKRI